MAKEIERKFIVDNDKIDFNKIMNKINIKQAYINKYNTDIKLIKKLNFKDKTEEFFIKIDSKPQLFFIKIDENKFNEMKNNLFNSNNEFFENTVFRLRNSVIFENNKIVDTKSFFTIKGNTVGITRIEIEMEIDNELCDFLINNNCNKIIDKTRYTIKQGKHLWEIDCFNGQNKGLIIAEIELESEEEVFEKTEWILKEVSDDFNYFNNNLLERPYTTWNIN